VPPGQDRKYDLSRLNTHGATFPATGCHFEGNTQTANSSAPRERAQTQSDQQPFVCLGGER
jgi:hypothetical protein